ncbi:hypothetical protein EC991_009882, partial [Linnemannia zychae]
MDNSAEALIYLGFPIFFNRDQERSYWDKLLKEIQAYSSKLWPSWKVLPCAVFGRALEYIMESSHAEISFPDQLEEIFHSESEGLDSGVRRLEPPFER